MSNALKRRRYASPPLVEAVMEFQFGTGADWDSVFFGRIFDQLGEFPDIETLHNASLEIEAQRVALAPQVEIKRFWREDRGFVVTVGPRLLALSALPAKMPEGHSWEYLRDTAYRVLGIYQRIVKPGPIRQTGLRYINAIDVDPDDFYLSSYITDSSGLVGNAVLAERNPFSLRIERIAKANRNYHLHEAVTLAAVPHSTSGGRLVLDVDEVANWINRPGPSSIRRVYEQMHDAVHAVFSRVIRPEVLASFGPLEVESGE